MSIRRYNKLNKLDKKFNVSSIITHIPSVEDSDYKRGYINRYFVQKSNDSNSKIYEIDSKSFAKFKENPFFVTADVLWVISGDELEVRDKNKKSILFSMGNMKALPKYLVNLSQFRKKRF